VVIQPSFYGADSRATLEGVDEFKGPARAVAVIDRSTACDPSKLQALQAGGVRGLRVNLNTVIGGGDTRDLASELAWQADVAGEWAGTSRSWCHSTR
jgi:predicted TIM-barrel fold metal-dependent hydrolase